MPSPPPKKNNLKTIEIWANARKNEENWGKYITKYILVISFQYAFQSFPSESIRPARLWSGGGGGAAAQSPQSFFGQAN
jgi:hypothetical protein